jgi:O-acetyl-ADP-ribose deacetylase (regulator of RNase III)
MNLIVIHADITTLAVDAIVNAANQSLLGGGGVDGAIHHAAGPRLREACLRLPEVRPGVRCPTGQARITPAFDLPARYIIHTVGPIWTGGGANEDELLRSCYRACLTLASAEDLSSIAFPAISTGAYGFPLDRAAQIAVEEIAAFFARDVSSLHVTLAAFDDETLRAYRRLLL